MIFLASGHDLIDTEWATECRLRGPVLFTVFAILDNNTLFTSEEETVTVDRDKVEALLDPDVGNFRHHHPEVSVIYFRQGFVSD